MKIIFSLSLALLLLSGCKNLEQHYNMIDLNVNPENANFRVAVQDHRPYVLSGDKADTFVGIARTGIGTPLDVNTKSGKPFAEDVSTSIKFAFGARGAQVGTYVVPMRLDEKAAISSATDSSRKTLLLIFNEWKSDTYRHTAMYYDFNAYVVDRAGNVTAAQKFSGSSHTDPASVDSQKRGVRVPQAFFKEKVEAVFSSPEIVKQLY